MVKEMGTILLFQNCELDSAVFRGFDYKTSGNFDVCSRPREAAVGTANECGGSIFKEEVRKRFGIGGAYDTGDSDFCVVMSVLVLIELYDLHCVFPSEC